MTINHQQSTLDGIAHMQASNCKNNAEMLAYIDNMAYERLSQYTKRSVVGMLNWIKQRREKLGAA